MEKKKGSLRTPREVIYIKGYVYLWFVLRVFISLAFEFNSFSIGVFFDEYAIHSSKGVCIKAHVGNVTFLH